MSAGAYQISPYIIVRSVSEEVAEPHFAVAAQALLFTLEPSVPGAIPDAHADLSPPLRVRALLTRIRHDVLFAKSTRVVGPDPGAPWEL